MIGTCALCKTPNSELRLSHLIPKLIWKRIKSKPKSSFRDLNNPNKEHQDGEKIFLLCDKCEKLFQKFEDAFAREFFISYMNDGKINNKVLNTEWMFNYCLSVSWRILYDDIYNRNSFVGSWYRNTFCEFEEEVSVFFNDKLLGLDCHNLSCTHYILLLKKIVKNDKIVKALQGVPLGYCIYNAEYNLFLVVTYYAGIVIVTEIKLIDIMLQPSIKRFVKTKFFKKSIIKSIIKNDALEEVQLIAEKYKENVTESMRERIRKKLD